MYISVEYFEYFYSIRRYLLHLIGFRIAARDKLLYSFIHLNTDAENEMLMHALV